MENHNRNMSLEFRVDFEVKFSGKITQIIRLIRVLLIFLKILGVL
jgi:hypothetical protein